MKKNQIFKAAIFAVIFLSSLHSFSQQTINVAGNSARINGMVFDYSIGEMIAVSTEKNANLIVTQGLLQPPDSRSGINDQSGGNNLSTLSSQVKVYPNPTANILFVETFENAMIEFNYTLFDATGKSVLTHSGKMSVGINKLSLDMQSYASGTYYLSLQKGGEQVTFKIEKLN